MIQILQPDHPMLRACRLLAFGDNVNLIQNLANYGGGAGVAAGSPTAAVQLGAYRAINGDGTDNIVTFGATKDYLGNDARDITVICRVRSNSSHTGFAAAARAVSSPTAGWQVLYSNFSGSETGWNFAVFSSGGKFMEAQDGVGDGNIVNKNVVFAGVYNHRDHEVYAFLRNEGEPIATIRNSHTNTNSGNTATEDWDVRAGTQPITLLALQGPATPGNLDLAWIAVFDRALLNDEIAEWSRDEEWPFLQDYPIVTAFTARLYETVVSVNNSEGHSGGGVRTESNSIDCRCYFVTGDPAFQTDSGGGGGPSITKSYGTTVGVGSQETLGQPLLKKYTTTISCDSTYTRAFQRTYVTRVGAAGHLTMRIDGRIDILASTGYRR